MLGSGALTLPVGTTPGGGEVVAEEGAEDVVGDAGEEAGGATAVMPLAAGLMGCLCADEAQCAEGISP